MKELEDKSWKALSRKEAFEQKLRTFRTATGKPERFTISCACSEHDKAFSVTYERMGAGERWRIGAIEKPTGEKRPWSIFGEAKPRLLEIPADETDMSGWVCPWCQDRGGYVYCNQCRTFVCQRRVTDHGGTRAFRCRDSCGRSSSLVPLVSMTGAAAPSSDKPVKPAGLLPRSAPRPSLPGASPPALGKPKR